MKKVIFLILVVVGFLGLRLFFPSGLTALEKTTLKKSEEVIKEATSSSQEATPAAVVEKIIEKKEDITESTPKIKGKLEGYLMEHPVGPLTITNFVQHGLRFAIKNGVPANTLVLILLFPLIVSLIVVSRHFIGIRGFGIFLPAVLSVVFVATGIVEGLLLFLVIIGVATLSRRFLMKLKLQYLPRMAMLLWCVSLGVLVLLCLSPLLNLNTLATISIFPILILILLAENFISIHSGMSQKEAVNMTGETLIMALVCSLVLKMDFLQKFVLLKPEITILGVAVLNIFMSRYVGLRLLEYIKFKDLLK